MARDRLLAELEALVALLRSSGEDFWADWIATDRAAIAAADRNALSHFLSAFGGMGSLNDVVLRTQQGRVVRGQARRALEKQFAELTEAAYADARAILKGLDQA